MAESRPAPLVSIVIVTYNAQEYVQVCLESIAALTATPHEVVVVDNASGDETRSYLQAVTGIKLILNDDNRLLSPAQNQALAITDPRSEYIVFINPDIEVLRADWLARMIKRFARPGVGLVGLTYHPANLGPVYGHPDGHCLMVSRQVMEHPDVAPLDERYPWNGSPYVLTARAYKAGWGYAILPSTPKLIHHFGGRSRLESDRPVPNRSFSRIEVLRELGFEPTKDPKVLAFIRQELVRWRGRRPPHWRRSRRTRSDAPLGDTSAR